MILVGSQRGGAVQLAAHLLNRIENDHVTLRELRGFTADDLPGALREAYAVSKGTKCRQFMFSLSLNPPKEAHVGEDELMQAVERAEEKLGLTGQPRAVVIHEKNGRRHAHAVWSRIDADRMKAVNLPHYKTRLNALARDLFLDHGWELPEGLRSHGWRNPLNFTLAEWQQARRADLDPREIKQVFAQAWQRSDGLASLGHALEAHGFWLAKGDRRGFVAVDHRGEVYSFARWAGVKTKDVNARLGDPERLPPVAERQSEIRRKLEGQMRGHLKAQKAEHVAQRQPLLEERQRLVAEQRRQRRAQLDGQEKRARLEHARRVARFRRGVRGLIDILVGRAASIRRQNEADAWECLRRDRRERDDLVLAHLQERRALQVRYERLIDRQRQERQELVATIVRVLHRREADGVQMHPPRARGLSLTP